MDSITELVENKTFLSASGDPVDINTVAKSLGLFTRFGSTIPGPVGIVIRADWPGRYKRNNGFFARLKHAWMVLTARAIAFKLS